MGLAGAGAWAVFRRLRPRPGLTGRTAIERAVSYAALALVLALATSLGTLGIAGLIGAIGAIALVEWSDLMDLPIHHRIGLQVANIAIVASVAVLGSDAAGWLVGGLVLVGLAWPVLRADTDRALRDLGSAAVGCIMIPGLLVHGVALAVERGALGVTLFAALAVACAGSDVGAFIVGRRFGRTPLAPILSPAKTREGVVGTSWGRASVLPRSRPCSRPISSRRHSSSSSCWWLSGRCGETCSSPRSSAKRGSRTRPGGSPDSAGSSTASTRYCWSFHSSTGRCEWRMSRADRGSGGAAAIAASAPRKIGPAGDDSCAITASGGCGKSVLLVMTLAPSNGWRRREADRVRGQRRRNAKRPAFLVSVAAGTSIMSVPNAAVASLTNRSAGIDRGAPMTIGTPSFTALR